MAAIVSMTGFGSAIAAENGFTARVEIRCVNHRALRVEVRSRPALGIWERNLREIIGKAIRRGAVEVAVFWARQREGVSPLQEQMMICAVNTARALGQRLRLSGEISVSDLLHISASFCEAWEEPLTSAECAIICRALEEALQQAMAMREREGSALAKAIAACSPALDDFIHQAQQLAPAIASRWRDRLTSRLRELRGEGLSPNDEQAIAREICLLAEKSDIQEEIARLASHVAQYRHALAEGGEVGKRLEFLAAEMLREINTAVAKAGDGQLVASALSAKLAVEKIREQAANIE